MKITRQQGAINISKPEGTNVSYYLFDEYEIHYNEQVAGSTQTWHHHEKIWETLYIIEGELTVQWKEGDEIKSAMVIKGDLIETERTPHTFTNHTQALVKFLVFKQVLTGNNHKETFKSDKVVDK